FAQPAFAVAFYVLCAAIGVLVGMEIPLLVKILEREGEMTAALSNVLAVDYVGALAGSILFPLVALPLFRLACASVVFGLLNRGVGALGLRLVEGPRRGLTARLAVAACALVALLAGSARLVGFLEDLLYEDTIIYARDTHYQRVVITRWREDV